MLKDFQIDFLKILRSKTDQLGLTLSLALFVLLERFVFA